MVSEPKVKSATRVFDILKAFEEVRKPLRLREIVNRSGFPTSSTAALLKSMTSEGILSFDRHERTYFPTERLLQLVYWLAVAAYETDAVKTAMLNLQANTGEFIALGTVNDIHVEFIDTMRSSHDIQYWNPPGTKRLLIQSGMGWLLLGQRSGSAIANIYKRTIKTGAFKSRDFSLERLISIVEKARRREFLFTRPSDFLEHPAQSGVGMIAMLVPLPANHRPLVLGVGGPADRLSVKRAEIVKLMQTEVLRLEQILETNSEHA